MMKKISQSMQRMQTESFTERKPEMLHQSSVVKASVNHSKKVEASQETEYDSDFKHYHKYWLYFYIKWHFPNIIMIFSKIIRK